MAVTRIGGGREWIGKIFFALAMAWFGGVFWVMRPDLPHADPLPTPVITLPDGTTHKVYLPDEIQGTRSGWIERKDIRTQYTYTEFLHRPLIKFMAIALLLPMTMLVGGLSWLAALEWYRYRHSDDS